jgi:hypothetical protein
MISQEQRATLLQRNTKLGWEELPSTAPAWVRAFVTEGRTATLEQRPMNTSFLRTHQQGVEQRSSLMLRTRRVTPTGRRQKSLEDIYLEQHGHEFHNIQDEALRQQADRILRQIRRDERQAEQHFIETASPAELLRALEAKCGMREQPGRALSAQPGSTPCTACTPDQHSKAATYHRTLASKAASWQEGAAHHTAADCHAKAAEQFNADNSVAARSASEKCLDEFGDEDQEDEY